LKKVRINKVVLSIYVRVLLGAWYPILCHTRWLFTTFTSEGKKKKAEMVKRGGVEGSAATLAAQFEEMETSDMPMIKLGDASVAAPFTSKMPSIRSCVDVVRQGRCTLVSSIQMYQIMALQCLISSYSLSVLYLDGVKYGDSQMTAMGMLGSISFMSVSRSKPLNKLSRVRPLNSIFHPALFCSLLGQFAIHITTMVLAARLAKQNLGPDYAPDLDGHFQPGILNTVVFLVNSVQQVNSICRKLAGPTFHDWLVRESLPVVELGRNVYPHVHVCCLNRYFQLVPFPDESFRDYIIILFVIDLFATFIWDRTMQFFFSREILKASVEGTTLWDIFGMVRTFAVIAFLMNMFLGNSETWEMLELEANATQAALDEGAAECVGDLCNQVVNETLEAIRQEL
jgi:cation-transporting ATPase 13A1